MYAKIKDGVVQYPYGMAELQADNPYTAFGTSDVLEAFRGTTAQLGGAELVSVEILPQPPIDATQVAELDATPTYTDKWVLGWTVRPKTAQELQDLEMATASNVRRSRDGILRDTDWTQLADVSDAISLAWKPYRQALRDIPAQPGFPFSVTWPVKPG